MSGTSDGFQLTIDRVDEVLDEAGNLVTKNRF